MPLSHARSDYAKNTKYCSFLGLQVVQSQHDEDEYLIMQPINKEELEQYGYLCEQETQDTDPKIHQGIIDE